MVKITECVIGVDLASAIRSVARSLRLKVPDGKLGFRCPECRKPVKPAYSAGGKLGNHFEHLKRNRNCSLSHGGRRAA